MTTVITDVLQVMVFNATFINISVIWWRSILIGEVNSSTWRKSQNCRKSLTNFIADVFQTCMKTTCTFCNSISILHTGTNLFVSLTFPVVQY